MSKKKKESKAEVATDVKIDLENFIRSTKIEIIDVESVILNPRNANSHPQSQIDELANLIKYQGFRNPIIISNRTGFLLAGHGRIMALKQLGAGRVPAIFQDFDNEAQEYAYLISDNEIARQADLDLQKVYTAIHEIPGIDLTMLGMGEGFRIPTPEVIEGERNDDFIPEPALQPKTKAGDLWLLGDHRLICGSSAEIDTVEKLMNGQRAEIVFTSPPYNVGKTPNGNDNKYNTYDDNKDQGEYLDLLRSFTLNALTICDYVFVNIQSLAGNKVSLIEYLAELKEVYADTIIWDKETAEPAMAHRVLNSRFEYVHIFSNEAKRTVGTKDFRGTIANIFSLNSRSGKEFAKVHRATFRVELPEYFLENFCTKSVYEPFAGTGTTLIAAEKKNMKCFAIELDESYCDIIIKRWEAYTSKQAILESTGETYEQVSRY